jgi:hypothetical protein
LTFYHFFKRIILKKAFIELIKISNSRIFTFPFCCSDEDDQNFHSKRRFFRQESGAKFMKISGIKIPFQVDFKMQISTVPACISPFQR